MMRTSVIAKDSMLYRPAMQWLLKQIYHDLQFQAHKSTNLVNSERTTKPLNRHSSIELKHDLQEQWLNNAENLNP